MAALTRAEMFAALCARHGEKLQRQFADGTVAVCGLGGLGSNIAIALARAGVGHIRIIDFDRVDVSNLNRQQYFPAQLGMYKTDALGDTLREIGLCSEITADCVRLTPENIPVLLKDADIICEAFDRADQKAMLVNTVLEQLPDKILVSGSGMAGLGSPNTIRTRKIAKNFYLSGDGESDSGSGPGLISARVAVCAAHQATTVLRLLAGETEP